MKALVRDDEWDVLWYLGGKNSVTVVEKQGNFHLLSDSDVGTVIDVLPFELVQSQYVNQPKKDYNIKYLGDSEHKHRNLITNTQKLLANMSY